MLAHWKRHVEETGGPATTALDGSRESLASVGRWLESQHEAGVAVNELVPGWTAYLAHCLQRRVPNAVWVFHEGGDASQHHPVLSGFTVPFDGQVVASISLRKFLTVDPPARTERRLGELERVYDAWVSRVATRPSTPPSTRPEVELVQLPDEDPFDFMVNMSGRGPDVDNIVARLQAARGVQVVREDRDTVLIRAEDGSHAGPRLRSLLGLP